MNKNIIFAGGGGLVVGSVITLLLTRRFYLKVIKDLCDVNDSLSEELKEAHEINHSVIFASESAAKDSQNVANTTTDYDDVLTKIEKITARPKPSLAELAAQTQYEMDVEDMFYDPDEYVNEAEEEDDGDEDKGPFNLFEKYADFTPESTSPGEKYLITEEEYGSLENYQFIELIQYDDGLIADKHDNLLDNVDDTLGVENVEQCEDMDIYWIRDDSRKIDYEIMRIEDRYADRMRISPFRMSHDIYTKDL